jgi:hypothetical protein
VRPTNASYNTTVAVRTGFSHHGRVWDAPSPPLPPGQQEHLALHVNEGRTASSSSA